MSYTAFLQGALGRHRRPSARSAALLVSGTVLAISGLGLVAPAQAAPIPGVDLQVTVTGPTNQLLGAAITDSILIANAGTLPATGVAFDLAPPVTGATYSITDPSVTCNLSWHCTLADLASGAQKAVVLKIATAAPLADGATVTAQATVSTTAVDVDPSNDVASASTELSPHSQMSLSIRRTSPGALLPGAPTTYRLTMKNNGPAAAVDPVVGAISPAPPFSSKVAGSASNGGVCHTQQSDSYAWCTWASVPAGATRTMSFTTTTSPWFARGDVFEVHAGVRATNSNGVTTATSSIVMSDSTTRPTDVSVTTYMTPSVKAGKRGDFKVTVTNHGPYRAHNVVVTAVLPSGAHWVGIAGGSPSDGTHSHTVGDLDTGTSYVVRGWFSMSVGGHMSMQYKVSHTDPDSKPSNNYSKSVSHILGPVVTVAHTKSSTATTTSSSSTPVVQTTSTNSVSSPTSTSSDSVSAGDASATDPTNVASATGQKKLADTGGPQRQLPLLGLGLVLAGGLLLLLSRDRRGTPRHRAWVSPYA